jgi:hypothetical protein
MVVSKSADVLQSIPEERSDRVLLMFLRIRLESKEKKFRKK